MAALFATDVASLGQLLGQIISSTDERRSFLTLLLTHRRRSEDQVEVLAAGAPRHSRDAIGTTVLERSAPSLCTRLVRLHLLAQREVYI